VGIAIAALALVGLAACGVPKDEIPRQIDAQDVPFNLLAPTTTTSPAALPAASPTRTVTVFFAQSDGRLAPVEREVEAPATLRKALLALLTGPRSQEPNLSTAITSETRLLHVRGPVDGLVTIDLSEAILDVTGRQQIMALAQVVYTATDLPDVSSVLFQFEGSAREVPNGDGTLTSTPLGRLSYRGLAAG
jgi:spore germination protein GerM